MEQIVNIPSSGGGLGQGSSSSVGPADEDFTGFVRTFPRGNKVRSWVRTRVRGCLPVSAHPRWRGSARAGFVVGVTLPCSAGRAGGGQGGSKEGGGQEEAEEEEEKEDEAVTFLIWVSGVA